MDSNDKPDNRLSLQGTILLALGLGVAIGSPTGIGMALFDHSAITGGILGLMLGAFWSALEYLKKRRKPQHKIASITVFGLSVLGSYVAFINIFWQFR